MYEHLFFILFLLKWSLLQRPELEDTAATTYQ